MKFFQNAFKFIDILNLCHFDENTPYHTVGFKTDSDLTIPANYLCTQQLNRGNLRLTQKWFLFLTLILENNFIGTQAQNLHVGQMNLELTT